MNIQFKKLATITILSMSLCLGLISCDKGDDGTNEEQIEQMGQGDGYGDNNGDPLDLSGNFSVKINDIAFVPTELLAVESGFEESMYIEVTDGSNKIIMVIQEDLSPGIYTFGDTISTSVVVDGFPEFSNINPTGTLTITTHDLVNNIFIGTFSFKVESVYHNSTITLTDGEFDFVYIQGT
ncbi:MAG: hypothetical protein ACSHW7_01055 [Patiriisocius sp.]|uniref:hypothetical protein n=1 Tax=Patiriisocius sp. TaxID=2822396 RepID=UPI003EF1B787